MRRKQHRRTSVRQQPVFKPSCEELEHRLVLSASTLSFTPLASSVALGTLPESAPFSLPSGFSQTVIQSRQGDADVLDNLDMNTLNETGPDAGRYLFTASETGSNAGVIRHDLVTGDTVVISRRADYERFDGIRWTPWGTVLVAEETAPGTDPDVPTAQNGLVYEILNPTGPTPTTVARPALGSKSHEGMAFDDAGNVYGIDEFATGGIFKFVPTTPGDLSKIGRASCRERG